MVSALSNLEADLSVDLVLSANQVRRYYDLHDFGAGELPRPFTVFEDHLAVTHHSRRYQTFEFVVTDPALTRLSPNALRHLAGVAEMRRKLGAPREAWETSPNSAMSSGDPDALWYTSEGIVAVEYDAGSYSPGRILRKLLAYRHFQSQAWASPSPQRVARLSELSAGHENVQKPFYALWC